MNIDQLDALVHLAGALLGGGALLLAARASRSSAKRAMLLLAILAGVASFAGYDRLRGQHFLHPSEQFHYVLGAKYFPELGYTGLYDAATWAAFEERLPRPLTVRNLVTNRIEEGALAYTRGEALAGTFRGTRWWEFRQDLRAFGGEQRTAHLRGMIDHGFNGTPAWIALARAVEHDAPIDETRLVAYAAIDVGLLAVLLLLCVFGFGLEATAIMAVFVGSSWVFRFAWTGGSFLRYDWVFALGAALVALRKERYGLAGGFLAWSTAARLFPAFFAVAAGLSLLFRAKDAAGRRALAAFVLGFALVAGLAGYAGARTGRGPEAWTEFAERIRAHHGAWASNHIGFDSIAVIDQMITSRGTDDPDVLDAFQVYADPIERARHARRPFLRVFVALALVVVAFAARRLPPWRAMPLGAILVFSASTISGYYWVMLFTVPLVAPLRTSVALTVATLVACYLEVVHHAMTSAHATVSVLYLLVFADWLRAELRGRPSDVVPTLTEGFR